MDLTHVARGQIERISPYWRANLGWDRAKRRGDQERKLLDSLVGRGMVVADVGASTGDFAARLAFRVGRRGTVHCFEPLPRHRERLERMARHHPQIALHPIGLSDRQGTAEIHIPVIRSKPRYGLASLRPVDGADSLEIQLDRLDRVLGAARRLDFVKCDVEGHELSVFEGGQAVILRHQPLLMVEIEQRHLVGRDLWSVVGMLEDWGYEGQALFTTGLRPLADFDLDRDQLAYVKPDLDSMPRGYVNTFLFTPRC